MTYVTEQTSAELRAHMKRLQAIPGWHNPLDDRLFKEVLALDAQLADMQTLFRFSKLGHEQMFERCRMLAALLRRADQQLMAWARKYGEHDPQWLPPDGDVRLSEDINEALGALPAAPTATKGGEQS